MSKKKKVGLILIALLNIFYVSQIIDACNKQHIFLEEEQMLVILVIPAVVMTIAIIVYSIAMIIKNKWIRISFQIISIVAVAFNAVIYLVNGRFSKVFHLSKNFPQNINDAFILALLMIVIMIIGTIAINSAGKSSKGYIVIIAVLLILGIALKVVVDFTVLENVRIGIDKIVNNPVVISNYFRLRLQGKQVFLFDYANTSVAIYNGLMFISLPLILLLGLKSKENVNS